MVNGFGRRKCLTKTWLGKEMTRFSVWGTRCKEGERQVKKGVLFSGLGNWVNEQKLECGHEAKRHSCNHSPISDSKVRAAHGSGSRKN